MEKGDRVDYISHMMQAESIEKILDTLDGWIVGKIVITNEGIFMQLQDGKLIPVRQDWELEVKNDGMWQSLREVDVERKIRNGVLDMDARFKAKLEVTRENVIKTLNCTCDYIQELMARKEIVSHEISTIIPETLKAISMLADALEI